MGFLTACARSGTLRVDGVPLASLPDSLLPAALIVVDPVDCLTCDPRLDAVRQVQAIRPGHVHSLLLRAATRAERSALNSLRLAPVGVLEHPLGSAHMPFVIIVTRERQLITFTDADSVALAAVRRWLIE